MYCSTHYKYNLLFEYKLNTKICEATLPIIHILLYTFPFTITIAKHTLPSQVIIFNIYKKARDLEPTWYGRQPE